MLSTPDEAQLAFATAEGRSIVTHDDDFLSLHASGVRHAGIIYGAQGMSIGDIVRGVMLIVDVLSDEEMHDHLEFL